MNPYLRRALIGVIAGLIASVVLAATLGHVALAVGLGALVGAA